MRNSRNLVLLALFAGLGTGVAAGQQAGSSAPTAPTAPAETVAAPARIYDEGPDLVAPQLLPTERTISVTETCKKESDDEVILSLTVGTNGQPLDVAVIKPKGTSLERLAQHVVEQDSFRPGTLKGEPVAMRQWVKVSIEGCFATKKGTDGSSADVFRLTAQPVQTFVGSLAAKETLPQERTGEGAAESLGLYRVGSGVSPPVPLNHVEAQFSDEARHKRISGVCLVTVIVDAQGKPQNPRLIRSLGAGLDEKAIEAVKKYRFKPAMKAGVPVPVMITVEVNFRFYDR